MTASTVEQSTTFTVDQIVAFPYGDGWDGGAIQEIDPGDRTVFIRNRRWVTQEGLVPAPTLAVGDRVTYRRGRDTGLGEEGTVTEITDDRVPMVYTDNPAVSGNFIWRYDKVTTERPFTVGEYIAAKVDGYWHGGTIAEVRETCLVMQDGERLHPIDVTEWARNLPELGVGDRVRSVRGLENFVGKEGTIAAFGPTGLAYFTEGDLAQAGGHFPWRFDRIDDEPTTEDEPTPEYQVGDWVTWGTGNQCFHVEAVTDTHLSLRNYGRLTIGDAEGLVKLDTTMTTGTRVRVARGYSHNGRFGTITRVIREEGEFDARVAEVTIDDGGSGSFYLHSLDPAPLTEEEVEHNTLAQRVMEAERSLEDTKTRIRRLAVRMKRSEDYCGALERFLDEAGIDPRIPVKGRVTITFDVTAESDTEGYVRDHLSNLEYGLKRWAQGELSSMDDTPTLEEIEFTNLDVQVTTDLNLD